MCIRYVSGAAEKCSGDERKDTTLIGRVKHLLTRNYKSPANTQKARPERRVRTPDGLV